MTDPVFLTASLPAAHGFFTRRGGVSTGAFASLNCSLSGQDDRSAVIENRARAVAALGARRLIGVTQVHGTACITVTDDPGSGAWEAGAGPRADAMATRIKGLALGIVTGDCAPVLFADGDAGVVAAAHAGWRGSVAGVLEATITAMVALGARAGRIAAAIGPCIHQSSYEVGADLRDAVLAAGDDDGFFAPGQRTAHWQFDLPGYCASRLRRAGVADPIVVPADTLSAEADFYSHRRRTLAGGGPIGHQISIIVA